MIKPTSSLPPHSKFPFCVNMSFINSFMLRGVVASRSMFWGTQLRPRSRDGHETESQDMTTYELVRAAEARSFILMCFEWNRSF